MSKKRKLYGGYEQDFVDKVANRFICQICTKVLAEPHLAVCCGQHFCESCLNEWFRKCHKKICPHCRAEGKEFNHVINKGLRSEIFQLKVRCDNSYQDKRCDWIGELGELKNHLESEKGCGFVFVACPNKCGEKMYGSEHQLRRMDLDEHLHSECSLRPHECEYCGFQGTYYAVTGDSRKRRRFTQPGMIPECRPHYDTCPEVPLTCPNECGADKIKRKCLKLHQMHCPLEKVECSFLEAGCKAILNRSQLDEHMASHQQAHLLMVMKDYKETKHKLRETEVKLSSAIATIQSLQRGSAAGKGAIDCLQRLSKGGDSINIMVPKISEVATSERIWYSPPFFYRAGYKLCLALDIRGSTFFQDYSISVALCLLRGEYDQQLAWPMQKCSTFGHVRYFLEEEGDREVTPLEIIARKRLTRFSVCSILRKQDHPAGTEPKELQKVSHFYIPNGNIHFADDHLVLKVASVFDGCALEVNVV